MNNTRYTLADIKMKSDQKCAYCGTHSGTFEIDHIIPKTHGGVRSFDNLLLACRTCNGQKGARELSDFRLYQALGKKRYNVLKLMSQVEDPTPQEITVIKSYLYLGNVHSFYFETLNK
jgi:CRISPR/Cas system Type II protein with McrA/HNH and RuvC-like nuclease domain